MNLPSHNNKKLFPIDQIIELATQKGYQWGKTSPKNRLRYYTKIGLLPNAKRKQADPSNSFTIGYYPAYVIDRLLQIQKLKKGKLTTRQITAKLEIEKLTQAIPANKLLTIQQIIKN
jgi:DNA-binding transcriptional MerR regulator